VATTAIAVGVILYVTAFASEDAIEMLGGTTSLLLLAIFALVNVAVLVLRRDDKRAGNRATDPRSHYKTLTALPVIGCVASLYLVTPLSGRPVQQYLLAAILVGSGVLLALATQVFNRRRAQPALPIDEVAPVGA
jgi:basic amino acid/polyamine antiporter, APA family